MPITGQGWEILVERKSVQHNGTRARTVGTYQVYHDGVAVPSLSGTTAESSGPGSNSIRRRRIMPGRYPLWTQDGEKYATIGYTASESHTARRRPGIELKGTEPRTEILIHTGHGFLSAIGCINLCTRLPTASEPISFPGSRRRVIGLIDDLEAYLGARFPARNGLRIPDAHAVIDGEP